MRTELRRALTAALRARDPVAVSALRSALSALDNATAVDVDAGPAAGTGVIAGGVRGLGAGEVPRRVPTAGAEREIVRAEVDERRAAARAYEEAGRAERAARLRAEAAVLAPFLEPAPTDD